MIQKQKISFWKNNQSKGEFDLPFNIADMRGIDKIAADNKIEWDSYYIIKYWEEGIILRRESIESHLQDEGPNTWKETFKFDYPTKS